MAGIGSTSDFSGASVQVNAAENCLITHLDMASANTEYSHPLQSGVKQLEFILDDPLANLRFSFVVSESGTKYFPVPSGSSYEVRDINFNSKTLYVQADKASQTLHIIEYY